LVYLFIHFSIKPGKSRQLNCVKKGRQQGYFELQRNKNRQQRLQQKRLPQQRKRLWQMPPQSLVLRCGKQIQKLDDSIHKPLYDKMHRKLNKDKNYTRFLTKRRSSTVEPVLGTLINLHNMKRVNARGIAQANKHVLMAALSYNLKNLLKFIRKMPKMYAQMPSTCQIGQQVLVSSKFTLLGLIRFILRHSKKGTSIYLSRN
jgi:hypothetical protein